MSTITIKNVGPIKSVHFELNKINVIIGHQSSGKSTIAKVISYCQWVEKRYILDGEFKYDFNTQFIKFHRMGKEYFNSESLINYESDFISIEYRGSDHIETIRTEGKSINYIKSKNIYIPAERNFVSVIPNLGKYKESNDNIMSFLYDWYDTKSRYSKKSPLEILKFKIKYHHEKNSDEDILTLENNIQISLKDASSGLQSVIPMTMLVDYLTDGFYMEETISSVDEKDELRKFFMENFDSILESIKGVKGFNQDIEDGKGVNVSNEELEAITSLLHNRSAYHFSRLIIEEPEQNLFPETQRDFIYFILNRIGASKMEHELILTTHSPFVLYAINNCLMGHNVSSKMPIEEQKELLSYPAWIDSKFVSIWEIDKNSGSLNSIKDEHSGTVGKHYFNNIMNGMMNEYYSMLNFFDNAD